VEIIHCPTAADWESWLAEHHAAAEGVWLKIAKKGSAVRSVAPAEATEAALCYGWIDSHRKSADSDHFLQKYSPRRPGSAWSLINVERAAAPPGRYHGTRITHTGIRPATAGCPAHCSGRRSIQLGSRSPGKGGRC
jgi:uncharacterized protein YdeI (YjbR/CyaY-like superfamily)